jgi:hypothetical protein
MAGIPDEPISNLSEDNLVRERRVCVLSTAMSEGAVFSQVERAKLAISRREGEEE